MEILVFSSGYVFVQLLHNTEKIKCFLTALCLFSLFAIRLIALYNAKKFSNQGRKHAVFQNAWPWQ